MDKLSLVLNEELEKYYQGVTTYGADSASKSTRQQRNNLKLVSTNIRRSSARGRSLLQVYDD